MYKERWNEICFLLSENIQKEISEDLFEKYVTQALRVIGWKQFTGDLEIRPSFQIGAANRISPDFIIKSEQKGKLFVIEIKQPHLTLTTGFQKQLFSYMRQLRLEYGLLIGREIQIFYDGDKIPHEDPILLNTIPFNRDSTKGEKFVELFDKKNFSIERLDAYTNDFIAEQEKKKHTKFLEQEILSEEYRLYILDLIKNDLINKYDKEVVSTVLDNFEVNIAEKFSEVFVPGNSLIITEDNQVLNKPESESYNKTVSEQKDSKISQVAEQAVFEIDNQHYFLKRFNNQVIRIFNSNNVMLDITVKPILRDIIKRYNLNIDLYLKSGVIKNTQILGKEIIETLNKNVRIKPTSYTTTGRDYSRYNVSVNGISEKNLNKRQAIFLVISNAIHSGIKPYELFDITNKSRWIWVDKVCHSRWEFEQQKIQNRRTYDAKRWFVDDRELLMVDEKTYAFSNQHNTEAFIMIEKIFKRYPALNGRIEKS